MTAVPRDDLEIRRRVAGERTNADRVLLTVLTQASLQLDELGVLLEERALVAVDEFSRPNPLGAKPRSRNSNAERNSSSSWTTWSPKLPPNRNCM